MVGQERVTALKQLKKECFKCTRCGICKTQVIVEGQSFNRHIFGVGNVNAQLMIVGQNGGYTELLKGIPLVGPSGKITDKVLSFDE